jgi:hypothetical protein
MTTIAAIVSSWPTPKRQQLLHEAIDSVYGQIREPDDVLIGMDYAGMGEIENMNRVAGVPARRRHLGTQPPRRR